MQSFINYRWVKVNIKLYYLQGVKVDTKLYHIHRGQGEHIASSSPVGVWSKERKHVVMVNK